MIIKLLPSQISPLWDYIRFGVLSTPSPLMDNSPEAIRNILRSLLIGELQCWLSVEKVGDKTETYGYMLTNIAEDFISKSRFLNIYDVYGFRPLSDKQMKEAIEGIVEFAKANKCNKITAYSNIPRILELSSMFGFTTDTRFLIKEL